MGNPLKDIFSTEKPQFVSTIHFDSIESRAKFLETINQASAPGQYIEIDGISRIDNYIKTGSSVQKLDSPEKGKSRFFIKPFDDRRPFTIATDYGDYTFDFQCYQTNDATIAETNKDTSVLYIKIALHKGGKGNINFSLNLNKATSVESLIHHLNAARYLMKKLIPDGTSETEAQLKILEGYENYWTIVQEIELFFGIRFNPQKFSKDLAQSKREEESILELYFLFVKKYMLKQNSGNGFTIKLRKADISLVPKIGQKMAFSYIDAIQQEIYGENFEFYTQNFILKAIVSEIKEVDDDTLKINVTGTDTEPLILTYRAYKTEDEIDTLPNLNEINFAEAKILSELVKDLKIKEDGQA